MLFFRDAGEEKHMQKAKEGLTPSYIKDQAILTECLICAKIYIISEGPNGIQWGRLQYYSMLKEENEPHKIE